MPTRGFITVACGPEYVRMAYALGLSIKSTQKVHSNLSVIVDDASYVLSHYREVFDQVFVVGNTNHAMEPRSLFYHLSPYDSTICLDADMVLLSDHSTLWEQLERQDITWADAYTFRDEKITNRQYRYDFDDAGLPDVYSAFFFFKKCDLAAGFFKIVQRQFSNWKEWRFNLLKAPQRFNRGISTDVAFAIAAKCFNITPIYQPRFVHFKTSLQGSKDQLLQFQLLKGGLFIDRYRQYLPFHYYDKNKTEDLIEWLGGV